jgi:hypothetical protein
MITKLNSVLSGRLDTGVGDHPDEDEVGYAALFQLQIQVGAGKSALREVLVDDDVAGLRTVVGVKASTQESAANACLSQLATRFPWRSKRSARGDAIHMFCCLVGATVLARAVSDEAFSKEILTETRRRIDN